MLPSGDARRFSEVGNRSASVSSYGSSYDCDRVTSSLSLPDISIRGEEGMVRKVAKNKRDYSCANSSTKFFVCLRLYLHSSIFPYLQLFCIGIVPVQQ